MANISFPIWFAISCFHVHSVSWIHRFPSASDECYSTGVSLLTWHVGHWNQPNVNQKELLPTCSDYCECLLYWLDGLSLQHPHPTSIAFLLFVAGTDAAAILPLDVTGKDATTRIVPSGSLLLCQIDHWAARDIIFKIIRSQWTLLSPLQDMLAVLALCLTQTKEVQSWYM